MDGIREVLVKGIAAKKAEVASVADTEKEAELDQVRQIVDAVAGSSKVLLEFLAKYHPDVKVSNFPAFPTTISTPDVGKVVEAVKGLGKDLKPAPVDDKQLIATLTAITDALKALPKDVKTDKMAISNLSELKDALAGEYDRLLPILEALKRPRELVVPAPKVSVAAPDFQPILDELKDQKSAIVKITTTLESLKFPVPTVPTDPLILYTPADVEDTDSDGADLGTQYFGYTKVDGSWYIRRYIINTVPKTLRFAFGVTDYATNWANRASLAYARWSE